MSGDFDTDSASTNILYSEDNNQENISSGDHNEENICCEDNSDVIVEENNEETVNSGETLKVIMV